MQTIIQDDEYVSISSANLNQRSLDGSRDTELGMGSWQPAHTLANAQTTKGASAAHGQPATAASSHLGGGGAAFTDSHGGGSSAAADQRDGATAAVDHLGGGGTAATGHHSSGGSAGSGFPGGCPEDTGYQGNCSVLQQQDCRNVRQEMDSGSYPDVNQPRRGAQPGGSGYSSGMDAIGSHMMSQVTPVGLVAGRPPSQSWGQTGVQSDSESSGCNEASSRGSLNQHQPIGSQPQGQWQNQGQGRDQAFDHKQEQKSGWAQGPRLPEQEGQRQGSGPGQTQGQGQNQQGDSEPNVAYPKGEVYGYRMSLWLEHLGGKYDPVYDQPHSLACVKRVNYLAEQNWLQFSGEEDCDMTGHLITFPIIVDQSGAVSARTVNGQFEDIDNTIKGKKQPIPAIFLN